MGSTVATAADCTRNGTFDWSSGSMTAELVQYPVYTLLVSYASVASVLVTVIFLEAALFVATRVPRSAVANHRINTVVMMSAFPVFVVCSLPAILIPSSAPFCLAITNLYYGFVMFKFVVLQVDYYGGHRKMMVKLAAETVMFNINSPLLCCMCCFKPVRLTRKTFTVLKILVLQVAFIRPMTTFFEAIAGFADLNLSGVPTVLLMIISMTSTLSAITGMNMLTGASSSRDLESYHLAAKSRLMSGGLLMSGLQPTLIVVLNFLRPLGCILPFPRHVVNDQWQSCLLVLESTLMMIPILRCYRTADGNVVGVPTPVEVDDEEHTTGIGKMRQWIRRHTLL